MNLSKILCKDCRKKMKAMKASEKAVRKLRTNPGADWQQKQSWKAVIAKGMRICPTDHETFMEDALLSVGYQFEKQKQIGPYIADFFIEPNVVIEVDGLVHKSRRQYDAARDEYMNRKGFHVLRFKNEELYQTIDGAHLIERIAEYVQP